MDLGRPIIHRAMEWLLRGNGSQWLIPEEHAPTRDIFGGRLDSLRNILFKDSQIQKNVPLMIAICGEIGNNSFDHNLGQWRDEPGIYLAWNLKESLIVLADRGQGVLKTLQTVEPHLQTDRQALEVAFTKVVSGRNPERRGNGLKFVKQHVENNGMELFFQSGNGTFHILQNSTKIQAGESDKNLHGCLAVLKYQA